jgi:FkbM family methyltransferase
LTWAERRNREYDAATVEIIRRVLKENSNSIDAGAHEGLILRELIEAAPLGRHFAFEPIPALADRLRRRYPRAVVHEVALADYTGETTFRYLPDLPALSSLHERPDREAGEAVVPLTVSVARLDDVVPRDLPIHFMKVDVEGSELALFAGALDTLRRWAPVVVFECHNTELHAVADVLAGVDYQIGLIDDFIAGRRRARSEVEGVAMNEAHWYFTAQGPAD